MILACKEIKKMFGINTILDNITFHKSSHCRSKWCRKDNTI